MYSAPSNWTVKFIISSVNSSKRESFWPETPFENIDWVFAKTKAINDHKSFCRNFGFHIPDRETIDFCILRFLKALSSILLKHFPAWPWIWAPQARGNVSWNCLCWYGISLPKLSYSDNFRGHHVSIVRLVLYQKVPHIFGHYFLVGSPGSRNQRTLKNMIAKYFQEIINYLTKLMKWLLVLEAEYQLLPTVDLPLQLL